MGESAERQCAKCGLIFGPFDEVCPRCARLAREVCSQCGQQGVVGKCERCDKQVCEACAAPREGGRLVCRACLALETGAARYIAPTPPAAGGPAPYALPETGLEQGLMPSLSRAGVFMREAFLMAFRDFDLLLPSLISISGGLLLLVALYVGAVGMGVDLQAVFDKEDAPYTAWLLLLAISLAAAFVHYFAVGATVSLVAAHLRGENARIGLALGQALPRAGAIFVLALVSTVVRSIAASLRRRHVPLAGAAIDEMWTVASYLVIPVIMLEHQSFSAAGRRAYDLHRKNLLGIAVGEIGVDLASRVAFFLLLVVVTVLVLWGMFVSGALAVPMALGVGLVGVMALASFQMYFRTAYYTCLYLWAAQREQAAEGEMVPAPAPLARALGY